MGKIKWKKQKKNNANLHELWGEKLMFRLVPKHFLEEPRVLKIKED